MVNQLRSASKRHNGSISLTLASNCATVTVNTTISNTHCILIDVFYFQQRYKLLTDYHVQIYCIRHAKNIIEKIRFSRFFHRWEDHHINLAQREITSTTNEKYMDRSIAYSAIEDISVWSKCKVTDRHRRFSIRIVTKNLIYFFQVNSLHLRDQLFHSIQWKMNKLKFECVIRSADSQEVLLKEIANMINFVRTTPIENVEVHHFPLEIISEILQEEFNLLHVFRKNVIETLAPLLEKNYPSPEMCDFFSRYCRDSPRSPIVIQMFTQTIEKILKHNTDFSEYPRSRTLVQEYLLVLSSQNDGLHVVQEFIKRMHGPTIDCPFLRVLSNLISVCLSGVYNVFQGRNNWHFEDNETCRGYKEETEIQLVCYTKILQTISTFYDWRHHLGLVLQPVPFPVEALRHDLFIAIFKNVLKNLVEDTRCEVHQRVLGIREGKDGWFEMFCLSGIACDDNGEMFSLMLNKLISCCCRKRNFLLRINKLLPALNLLALRENQSSLDALCAMLEFNAVENHDNKLQLISTLQSTFTGLIMYVGVCRRKRALRIFQRKGGPRELILPTYSTDDDLARLLSRGPFGNLEYLNLASTYVTSACAKHLIKLPALRYLDLSSTRFGDDGLELISEHLHQLKVLDLSETPVTNKGFVCLARMKMLQVLRLTSTSLSSLTFETLKEELPALTTWDIRYTDAW
ncbi:unnamed protein product [Rotaria sordida]|uniref:C-Maf-inducing protein PH domain-containing protein n=1 Tax=Rotaria sordida TaxID=392033 RepID=A0A819E920_9BILA|nr:unnamed protein product [Rotaria sordida]